MDKIYYMINIQFLSYPRRIDNLRKEIVCLLVCTLLIVTALPVSGVLDKDDNLSRSKDWLIMVYLDGDNDIWSRAAKDLEEILTPRSAPRVDITILYDTNDTEDQTDTILYHMKSSTISEYAIPWTSETELNMSDGDNLEGFVDWSLSNFPADRNMLVMWDHGGSWKGCCEDDSDDGGWLRPDEMRDAFDNALGGLDLDILYFAACYMAGVEISYELREYTDYYIGSEYVGWMGGSTHGMYCDFDQVIQGINTDNDLPVDEICEKIIDNAIKPNCIAYCPEKSHTFSVIKMSQMNNFINVLDTFAQKLIDNFNDPTLDPQYCNDIITSRGSSPSWSSSKRTDIYDFAELLGDTSITDALDDLIVYEWHKEGTSDATVDHAHGLHLVFPKNESRWDTRYMSQPWIENFRNVCAWDDWLQIFYDTNFVDDDFSSSTPCWDDTCFAEINDAIDAVDEGDTIWVFNGDYDETVFLDKTINIHGVGNQVKIDCDILTYGMMIYSDWVNVSGFIIENNLYCYWGILLNADHCTIYNNTIKGQRDFGIQLMGASENTITGNWLITNGHGVHLVGESNDNLIYNNYFNNTINAYDNGVNKWNVTKVKQENVIGWPWTAGNYWSDYYGQDTDPYLGKDALGDSLTPHNCSGNIHTGGDMQPLLMTVCVEAMKIDLPPGLYILDKHIPLDLLKIPVIIGPVTVNVKIMKSLMQFIDNIIITVNGELVWESDGPIVEPPIHHWSKFAFGKCEYVVTTTDIQDNTMEHVMNAWKFF